MYLGTRTAKKYCWAIMIASPVVRVLLKYHGYKQYSHLAPAIGDSLAAGCLLAFYEEEVSAFARKHLTSRLAFMMLCLATVAVSFFIYRHGGVALWGAVPCLLALTISAAIERKDGFLNKGVLAWTGLLSYSLYLWQQPFLVFDGPLNYFSARILMTFLLAYLSYRFIEQPALQGFNRVKRGVKLASAAVSID